MSVDISKLNTAQKEAVTHGEGPALLVAGAGTGKTTVVTNRIAWLIQEGKAKPEEILAVTFTEKAAAEMEERVDQLLPLGYTDLWIHTFHAFCQRVLQQHALDIGLPTDCTVFDQTAVWILMRENLDRFELDYYKPLGNPTRFIHGLVTHFSRCKDEGVYPQQYLEYAENLKLDSDTTGDQDAAGQESKRINELASAYHTYQQLLLEHNALDFGDLINYTLKLFRERPKIRDQYRARFKYILVDEFQDTNWAQYELMKILAAPANNLMVVGDDDQSIYKFRGASFSNIVLFKKEFPTSREIFLTDNYRSGQKILDVAYQFIQRNNPDRLEIKLSKGKTKLSKKLKSHSASDGEISLLHFRTGDDEVRGVIEQIEKLRGTHKDFSWNDVAILVRANDQAQRFVRYFRSLHVPHQFMAAKGLYSQEVILVILSYLKLLDNYHESEALYKVLSLPVWGLANEDLIHLNHLASKKSWSLWHAIQNYHGDLKLSEAGVKAIEKFLGLVAEHTKLAKKIDPSVLIYRFLEDSGYLEVLTLEDNLTTREQLLYLNQFYKKVRTWEEEHLGGGVKEFIDFINLELESGELGTLEQDIEEGPEQIKLSTIHSAKGLEYRFVFVIGVVHLRFPTRERKEAIEIPSVLIKDVLPEGDAHLQEERRLMYVALTRAKEKVFITYANDYGTITLKKPSRFIEELGFPTDIEARDVNAEIVLPETKESGVVKYALPAKFSYTQIKAFATCPKQYYYAHVIKIPSAGRAVFSFGKVIHATLEKFFQLVKERGSVIQGDLFGSKKAAAKKAPVSEKELLGLYEQLWVEDWFFNEEEKKKYYERGRTMLKEFYASLGDTIPVPVALEQPFTIKVGDVSFKGVIDRIDEVRLEAEPAWKLIDYKTGKPPKDGKLSFADKEQLLIYQLAAKEVFGKKVAALVLYFLNTQQQFEFLGTDKELEKIRSLILDTVQKIKTSDFAPTPGFWCQSCDYRFICPAAQR
ncbi:MAG: ATP-dependent helicase [Candidatus Komeilibacteria bacterium]|nr:ATP-dependent helicase [Candidatus Komeilibacteria bacterium]